MVLLALQAPQGHKVLRVLRVRKDHLELLALQVPQGLKDQQAPRVRKAYKVPRVLEEQLDCQVHKVLLAPPDLQELHRVLLVLQVHKDLRV